MAFRKLFFKRVQGIRDNYLLQEGDIALDEDDFQLYRGDGTTIGGVVIAGATSAVPVSTGNGTDVSIIGGESTATGSTGGNTVITGGIGVATGGNVNINGGNGSTDGNINIGTENTTLITIGTGGNNIDFPATTTIDFTGATVTGLGVSGIANDIVNDTTPQLGGNLDLNNFDITGTGDINITGTVTASGGVTLAGTTDVDTITTDGLTITDNNVSANRSNDDLILSSSGTGSININGTVTGTGVLDEDNMASNSANHLATQQSIKAYVDTTVAATNELVEDSTPQLGGDLDLNSNNITGTGNINITGTITSTGGFTGTTDFNTITTDGLTIADNNVSANRTNDDLILSASGTGNVNINSNAKFNDNVKLLIGDSDDLQIWHNGSNSIIQNSTGELQLRGNTIRLLNAATDEDFAFFNDDGSVDLYHNNTKRFETTATGAKVSGSLQLGSTTAVSSVLDEDDFSSNSATALATQQSIKAYVDANAGGGGGSSLQSRSTKTGNTNSLADAAQADLDITGFKAYALLTISTDRAARVRLYVSAATRTADASRAEGVDPTSDAGLIAEVITTGNETVIISPGAYGFNLESTPTTTIPCRVTNKSGSTATVQVTLKVLQLEA